jgi:hypothetical protein
MHLQELWNGYISDDWDTFADLAIQLYKDQALWTQAQANGFALLESHFNKYTLIINFWKQFEDYSLHLKEYREQHVIRQLLQHNTLQSKRYLAKWIAAKNTK